MRRRATTKADGDQLLITLRRRNGIYDSLWRLGGERGANDADGEGTNAFSDSALSSASSRARRALSSASAISRPAPSSASSRARLASAHNGAQLGRCADEAAGDGCRKGRRRFGGVHQGRNASRAMTAASAACACCETRARRWWLAGCAPFSGHSKLKFAN